MRLGFLLAEAGNGMRRNVSMFVSIVIVTMVSMLFLGAGLLAQRQVDAAKDYWYDRIQVSVFLCTDGDKVDFASCADGKYTPAQKQAVQEQLDQTKPLVKQYWYETEQEAYDRFKEQYKDSDLAGQVRPEDMPASYRVQLSDPSKVDVVVDSLQGTPGVSSVDDPRKVLKKFFTFLDALTVGALALSAVMVLCAILLITTTIRQTAWSRRRETSIMRLVGASASSIQLPFIVETVLAALLGAGLAVTMLWLVVRYGVTGFLRDALIGPGSAANLVKTSDVLLISPWLVGGSLVLAVLTSWAALRRYLKV